MFKVIVLKIKFKTLFWCTFIKCTVSMLECEKWRDERHRQKFFWVLKLKRWRYLKGILKECVFAIICTKIFLCGTCKASATVLPIRMSFLDRWCSWVNHFLDVSFVSLYTKRFCCWKLKKAQLYVRKKLSALSSKVVLIIWDLIIVFLQKLMGIELKPSFDMVYKLVKFVTVMRGKIENI